MSEKENKEIINPTIKLPIDTPFEELPPIFKNWNKQDMNLQLTESQLVTVLSGKEITISTKFHFPNIHNRFLINKMNLTINLSIKC